MFLVNSRFPLVSAAHTRSQLQELITRQAPLLPKLRGHFAEFLNHDSLDRLSILYLITCVGLGYGRTGTSRRCFSRQHRITESPQKMGRLSGLRNLSGGFANHSSYTLGPGQFHCLARLPSCVTPVNTLTSLHRFPPHQPTRHPKASTLESIMVSIHSSVWAVLRRYGNINPLSIDYACRPRLRPRLTQGRLA